MHVCTLQPSGSRMRHTPEPGERQVALELEVAPGHDRSVQRGGRAIALAQRVARRKLHDACGGSEGWGPRVRVD